MSHIYSVESSRLAAGTRLNGIFEIDRPIASGGMGEVYQGHVIETGDPVAIKVMRTDLVDNATALALFRKEASALHNLHHEAIVRYYVFSSDPGIGRHYLAMEFVDGQPLSELLQRGPLGFEAVQVLQQRLAAGLNAAHQPPPIIHRDLSPDNVLIPSGDLAKAKIIDFGIARSTRTGEGTIIGGGFAGKYNYVSPEQLGLFGGDVTPKSDIYSLGLVLAECLTGRPIDMGGTQLEVLEKRRTIPDLRAIDRRFRPLLEKMLQPNPSDRPDSMAAVAAWRPRPESPPGRADRIGAAPVPAATRDRGQAARSTAAATSKPMFGRRLTIVALASTLLLVIVGVVMFLPPPSLPPPPPPPIELTDPQTRITQFVNAYDGGDCFFVEPRTINGSDVTLEGLGSLRDPFEALNSEFHRQFGFEATIGWGPVTPQQCPAVNFLSRIKNDLGMVPRLEVDTSGLRKTPPGPLTGSISKFGDRHVELLLIADDGYVGRLTEHLGPSGNAKTFSVNLGLKPVSPGQLLLVIASSKPLEALKIPENGPPADAVFRRVLAEALQTGQALSVTWQYFMLEK